MVGGRSDNTTNHKSKAMTVEGIKMMHLNQMGDLVGENR